MLAFAWNQRGSVLGEMDNFEKDFDNFVLIFGKTVEKQNIWFFNSVAGTNKTFF
jgi:hypothetical protein